MTAAVPRFCVYRFFRLLRVGTGGGGKGWPSGGIG
jgi:hypothetical protein